MWNCPDALLHAKHLRNQAPQALKPFFLKHWCQPSAGIQLTNTDPGQLLVDAYSAVRHCNLQSTVGSSCTATVLLIADAPHITCCAAVSTGHDDIMPLGGGGLGGLGGVGGGILPGGPTGGGMHVGPGHPFFADRWARLALKDPKNKLVFVASRCQTLGPALCRRLCRMICVVCRLRWNTRCNQCNQWSPDCFSVGYGWLGMAKPLSTRMQ